LWATPAAVLSAIAFVAFGNNFQVFGLSLPSPTTDHILIHNLHRFFEIVLAELLLLALAFDVRRFLTCACFCQNVYTRRFASVTEVNLDAQFLIATSAAAVSICPRGFEPD
jgi:hypothetical protein